MNRIYREMLWRGNGAHGNKILVNVENGETYEIDERCKSKLLPFQNTFSIQYAYRSFDAQRFCRLPWMTVTFSTCCLNSIADMQSCTVRHFTNAYIHRISKICGHFFPISHRNKTKQKKSKNAIRKSKNQKPNRWFGNNSTGWQ